MNRHQITELGALERALKESTVRTVLARLEQKGYLTHSVEVRACTYRPLESRAVSAARAVRVLLDRFCNGSLEEVPVGLTDAPLVDQRELQRLVVKLLLPGFVLTGQQNPLPAHV